MVEGFEPGPDTDRITRFNQVGTNYFRTLGIPVLAGRTFTDSDVPEDQLRRSPGDRAAGLLHGPRADRM